MTVTQAKGLFGIITLSHICTIPLIVGIVGLAVHWPIIFCIASILFSVLCWLVMWGALLDIEKHD